MIDACWRGANAPAAARNSNVGMAIGHPYGITVHGVQCAAPPYDRMLHEPPRTPFR